MKAGQRRGPVGPGYMPKGGRRAAQLHNEAVARTAAPSSAAPSSEPHTQAVRTDGRGSDRSAWSTADRIAVVVSAAVVSVSPWLAVAVLR